MTNTDPFSPLCIVQFDARSRIDASGMRRCGKSPPPLLLLVRCPSSSQRPMDRERMWWWTRSVAATVDEPTTTCGSIMVSVPCSTTAHADPRIAWWVGTLGDAYKERSEEMNLARLSNLSRSDCDHKRSWIVLPQIVHALYVSPRNTMSISQRKAFQIIVAAMEFDDYRFVVQL